MVAPRSVNDVSYVLRINHDIHFEWQAHYLLRCVVDGCSIYLTGIIWVPCLCAPRSISSSNIDFIWVNTDKSFLELSSEFRNFHMVAILGDLQKVSGCSK